MENHSILRSQEEMYTRFFPPMASSSIVFKKTVGVFARRGVKGEVVTTTLGLDKKVETTNTVEDDDSWVVYGKKQGELYVLTDKQFSDRYTKPGKEPGDMNNVFFKDFLERNGFLEYEPTGKIKVRRVCMDDLIWFWDPNSDGTDMKDIYFESPWGEPMIVELGDIIAMPYPEKPSRSDNEFYRISYPVFRETYTIDA